MLSSLKRGLARILSDDIRGLGDDLQQLTHQVEELSDRVASLSDRFTRAQKGRRDTGLLFDPVALEQVGKFLGARRGGNGGGDFDG